ncbi:SH3 domain-containing protein [Streptomyces sp. ML-6]|uniref:SH3 domain-containing protein n=1 Tax=unclassified Streptomyces TaxID=2593676 RepID=UPI0024BF24C1|nr:SH3 domain-containing protein [Streptomyces sp. ML-6]MDK0523058.1 SH3 domain-containing protein [Streptomyces sp. ML-6]
MVKKMMLAATVLAAGLGFVLSPAAQAAQSPVAARAAKAAAAVCTVNDNGVNFRGGPGSNFPVLGQVNRGQKLNAHGQEGSWIMGDLWGGRTGVWIHTAYLDC